MGPSPQSARARAQQLPPDAFEQLFQRRGGLLAVLDAEGRFIALKQPGVQAHSWLGAGGADRTVAARLKLHPHEPSTTVHNAAGTGVAAGSSGSSSCSVAIATRTATGAGCCGAAAPRATTAYASAKDVTEWIRLEGRVGRDPLTNLCNREVFADQLGRALARHARFFSSLDLGVLFIDVDCFKQINDSAGPRGRRSPAERDRSAPARRGPGRRRHRAPGR